MPVEQIDPRACAATASSDQQAEYIAAAFPDIAAFPDTKVRPGTLERYVSGFSWTMLGTIAAQAGTYLSMILMARMLGLDAFGRLGTVQATLTAVFNVSTLATGITSTRFVARYRTNDPERAGRIMGLCALTSFSTGVMFSILLVIFAGVISHRLFHAGDLAGSIRLTAPYCALMTMNSHQIGSLLGFEAYSRLLRAQVWQGATTLLLTFLLVTGFGFKGAIVSLPFAAAFAWLYMHRELTVECRRHGIRPTFRHAWKERSVLTSFALPATVSSVIGQSAIWWAQSLLVRVPGGMLEMGLWTAAAALRSVVTTAPAVLNRVSLPILSSLHDHETGRRYRQTLWSAVAVATGGAALAGLLILLTGPLLLIAFGENYRRALPLLPLLIGSAVIEVYVSSVYQAVLAHARMMYQTVMIAIWGITLVLIAFLTIPHYRGQGLALSYLISWSISAVVYTLVARGLLLARGHGRLATAAGMELEPHE